MKTAARFVLLSFALAINLLAQTGTAEGVERPIKVQITSSVAEKLLIHKEPVACPQSDMAVRVVGTVVVAIKIDKNGNVLNPRVISGAQMLRSAALDDVRKYKYKPYILNGESIDVETTVSVKIDTLRGCP